MKKNLEARTETLPPHAQLIQMGIGYRVSQIVYTAAKLGLADHLANQSKSAAELAELTHTKEPLLYRLMRTLASLGILSEDIDHRFTLTPLGEALKSDAPGSARATILAFVDNLWWQSWSELLNCLETGETGVEKAFGMTAWDYMTQRPQALSYFNEAMIGIHGSEPPAVAKAYDFSGFETVVDVGGGTGNLLAAILNRHPGPRGILFELPNVVSEASALIQKRGLADRVNVEAGDFFTEITAGGDAYLLSHVIHDWNDDHCITILENCYRAMNPTGKLLIIEMVLPAGDKAHPGKLLDIEMIVMMGGQERTEQEYCTLLGKAGFRLTRVIPTESTVSVVEAIPV